MRDDGDSNSESSSVSEEPADPASPRALGKQPAGRRPTDHPRKNNGRLQLRGMGPMSPSSLGPPPPTAASVHRVPEHLDWQGLQRQSGSGSQVRCRDAVCCR